MSEDKVQKPTQPNQRDALTEARRLMAAAEGHERLVALREDSVRFLDERREMEGPNASGARLIVNEMRP